MGRNSGGVRETRALYERKQHSLQRFADKIYANAQYRSNGSFYRFGKMNSKIEKALRSLGVENFPQDIIITDKVINKYRKWNHPKEAKGAVINRKRMIMLETAVKHPKDIYIDTKRSRLILVATGKYSVGKIVKAVIDINQRVGRDRHNVVRSVGIVNKEKMSGNQYKKI